MKWTLSWVFVVLMFHECRSAHILVLTVFGSKSHKIALMPIVKELAGRNHSITFVTPYKSQEVVQGVREINTGNLFKLSQSSQSKSSDFEMNWFELNQYNPLALQYDMMKAIVPIFGPVFNGLMNDPEFDKVLKDRQVDLVIVDDSYHDFCLPIIEHLGAPFILHSASTGYPWTWNAMGASQELASVPNRFSPYDNEMTFRQRLYNAVAGMFVTYVRTSLLIPATDAIVKERFPNARSISAIEKDASLFFISSKVATYWPRQLPPTVIPLGPLHVRPAQPLPQEFQQYVDESGEDGFILFSLGSVSSSKHMPKEYVAVFLKTFARLPLKVIWKWDSDDKPENVPANVMLAKWLPQQDLLGDAKARIFMTHGGLLGMQESVYHGVPLLAFPFATDQHMNAAKGIKEGCSLKLDWQQLDEQKLYQAITTMLNEPSFQRNASRLSNIMRDQLVSGKDTAAYWVEHVIRHNGTKHLKLASQHMPFYQVYLLDVALFFIATGLISTIASIYLLVLLQRLVKRLVCRSPKPEAVHLKNQ